MKSVQTEMKEEIIRISASQETLKEVVQERLSTMETKVKSRTVPFFSYFFNFLNSIPFFLFISA